MKQKVYISGPMTGIKDFNRPAFNEAARVLTACGYETLNPADGTLPIGTSWEDYMRADIAMLMQADIIYMLPGWERSKGSRIEFNLAVDLKMEVVFEIKN